MYQITTVQLVLMKLILVASVWDVTTLVNHAMELIPKIVQDAIQQNLDFTTTTILAIVRAVI